MTREAVIVGYGRSPVGKAVRGTLADEHPVEYAAEVLNGVLKKVENLDPSEIDDIIVGCAMPQESQGMNMARVISQRAGIPDSVSAQTVNRFCSSGLQTIATGANAIIANQSDIIVAGGVESMSLVPMGFEFAGIDPWVMDNKPGVYASMGLTAENVAVKDDVNREDMDQFALESHHKAQKAQEAGLFKKEIIPVTYGDIEGNPHIFSDDESIRYNLTLDDLAGLGPAFQEDGGTVTAGTSSPLNDGAAFVILMERSVAEEKGIKPIAKFVGFQVAGLDALLMGEGPIYAIPKVMERTGLSLDDMDIIELNEAFGSQSLACIRELELDVNKVNPRGGAIALGHPLGATGAILTCKALSYLEDTDGKYGLVSMCIGGGMGAAGIFEMI
ncbi:thiolase family protein [Enterococcus alishanensis]|uniref:acetyl-CoA C-acyltransferase n=1 Tax=Enterococcus alishanensis TaxID=1303817 RepID=A0ABS6T7S6_9ENTE|nr:thiolase family protein [Enterococcus alishanensis]MBV7389145.1 thiolase family protein [Enterococcus alishanensis]